MNRRECLLSLATLGGAVARSRVNSADECETPIRFAPQG